MMKTRKIWVGIGTFIMVGSALGGAATQAAQPATSQRALLREGSGSSAPAAAGGFVVAQHHGAAAQATPAASAGGEAGGEGGAVDLPPDLAFAVRIALIRGHLLIGDELVSQKRWSAALPHFLHPVEEIYPALSQQLEGYRVAPFERALKTLSDTVKARKGGADYTRAKAAVNSALGTADARLENKQSANWAGFEIEAAVEILKVAGSEYGSAIEKGRIVKPVEYQDARGFITHAEKMIEAVAADLAKKDAEALKDVRAALAELKKAFPQAVPPKVPVKDPGAVLSEISRIELAASRLM